MTVETHPRPYALTFASGNSYLLSRADADRLLAEHPIARASRNRVELRSDDGMRAAITAATLGGGPAFTVHR